MNNFHRVLTSFDHQRVVKELTEAGVLFSNCLEKAAELLAGQDRHINIGHFDFRQSPYLMQWLKDRELNPNRMGAFVSTPLRKPTVWHKDGPLSMCALNIPWFGTEGTYTEWCGSGLEERIVLRPDNSVQRIEGIGVVEPTERIELHRKAVALNVSAFHRVYPEYATTMRGILSLRFPNGYHYHQLCEVLDRYEY